MKRDSLDELYGVVGADIGDVPLCDWVFWFAVIAGVVVLYV